MYIYISVDSEFRTYLRLHASSYRRINIKIHSVFCTICFTFLKYFIKHFNLVFFSLFSLAPTTPRRIIVPTLETKCTSKV
jgi:hypothetical protein